MSKHYPVEQRERAVKMVLDHLREYRSVYAACQAIGRAGLASPLRAIRRWVCPYASMGLCKANPPRRWPG